MECLHPTASVSDKLEKFHFCFHSSLHLPACLVVLPCRMKMSRSNTELKRDPRHPPPCVTGWDYTLCDSSTPACAALRREPTPALPLHMRWLGDTSLPTPSFPLSLLPCLFLQANLHTSILLSSSISRLESADLWLS